MQPNLLKVNTKQKREEFKLRISGVEFGKHSFSIDCDNTFFELAEIPDLREGELKLRIEMEIFEKMVLLDFHFDGNVVLPCDRCLDPVQVKVKFDQHLVVKLVPMVTEEDEEAEDDDMWVVDENTYELDVFHYVYEAITLALPSRVVHPDNKSGHPTCNPEILKKLEELSGHNSDGDDIDPRWEALRNLK